MSIVAIDCGATKLELMLIDDNLEKISYKKRFLTPNSYAEFTDLIASEVNNLKLKTKDISKFGMGVPGVFYKGDGQIKASSIKYLSGKPIVKDLESLLHIEVKIENDSKCFALAEARLGAGKKYNNVVGLIVGTGLAAGFVIDKQLAIGAHGMAGEIGHYVVVPNGALCQCGHKGCYEAYAAGRSLPRLYFEQSGKNLDNKSIYQLYLKSDKNAIKAINIFIEKLASAMATLINLTDPDIIVVGGGLSNLDIIYKEAATLANKMAFADFVKTKIVKNKLGDSAGIYGACLI